MKTFQIALLGIFGLIMLWIYFQYDTYILLNNEKLIGLDLSHQLSPEKPFKLQMTAVGDRVEVRVDGRRIFYGPLLADEPTRQLAVRLHLQGMTGSFNDIGWRTAVARGHM